MEVIVKARLLLTSALFVFVQIPVPHAQETLDLAKITCDQLAGEKLAASSRDVELWLSGYYNGERHNTIVEPLAIKKHADQINLYCLHNRDTTVMDAVKNVLGLDK
jgi:HdeA/HdeB family